MLKFLIAILVIFSLLSNLNAVNGKDITCFVDCINKEPNFYKDCPKGALLNPKCRAVLKNCKDECNYKNN
ncbi:hypothetical protein DDB_G0273111 [Dictyostelium discoideum AX4]|uniref:Uncharacterized protein n=1 Tax=Dictyostelium discoideum TaxID=44689 RepID=Q556S8_DICDI|nr:hypothetical protein DDB_G0273849 [Dictyostelium discoideum AX4]XP_644709.1 hypothetical protein DDB_G0273111 [Dictyostelium discoideum AX4]EAL70615.1 hypothetical protein DDB_G0273849 [Dictyostelium discoideum AX4]EAL70773.1 hypothetical protein DDB_G0273111 [Dictyostelium discoideum AX4]|eukprot:XP_644541.1 hypothetical protein DDB_G0273849 [Dictyostelium discoideum AX4]